ncbi:MAG: aspartate kinase [Bacteroidales bacterium]|nr:aspartate kinase [Bacteroidales bacterium]MCF6342176.1 aspartate kinase [Bacteroidales bacterium]
MTKIFKFGGALMKDAAGIEKVAAIVGDFNCEPLVVVVSALGKTTNRLEELLALSFRNKTPELQMAFFRLKQFHLEIAQRLLPENARQLNLELENEFVSLWDALHEQYRDKYAAYDSIVGFGEDFSGIVLRCYLQHRGIGLQRISARKLIVTNSNHTDAAINWELTENAIRSKVLPVLENNKVLLTQGFTGADETGQPTTLGREGSDFTAAVFAHVLQAAEVSIWKDVPGLMNCDPWRFEQAVKLPQISYHEAIELAFYGASVIHPKTIQPLQLKNIPLKVRSFHHPESTPSLITNDTSHDSEVHKIIVKDKQVLLSIGSRKLSFIAEENLTGIFRAFSKNKIHINLMQNSAVSFSVCFNEDKDKLEALMTGLKDDYQLKYNTGLQLITIRHYTDELIETHTIGKEIFLEQKSRATVQLLVRDKKIGE